MIQTETKTATRLNWSTLRHLAVSAKLLKWRVEHPQTDTLDMRLGRAIHCAILEPEAYPKRWIVAGPCAATKKDGGVCGSQGSLYLDGDWFCRVRGHGPEGSGPLPEGVEVLTEADVETVKISAAAVAEHKLAAKTLSGGLPEHEIEWTEPETGIACRGRIDYLRPSQVVDLKSTIEETVRAFERTVANRMYHAQLAWYHDGAVHAGRLQPDAPLPVIVSVQKVEPYDVVVYQLSKHTYQAGQILYRDLLLRYRDCVAADHWPGIAPSMVELELPKWAPGMNGSEYEGGGW